MKKISDQKQKESSKANVSYYSTSSFRAFDVASPTQSCFFHSLFLHTNKMLHVLYTAHPQLLFKAHLSQLTVPCSIFQTSTHTHRDTGIFIPAPLFHIYFSSKFMEVLAIGREVLTLTRVEGELLSSWQQLNFSKILGACRALSEARSNIYIQMLYQLTCITFFILLGPTVFNTTCFLLAYHKP